ncbi:Coenzyme F420 hydrogenase/dehydrogenase, beta subunit C-terminal domain [Roseobacter sp.]|uniref:Coenzyme F420 hydrogenase/dehydrogenase, beta subunit C-terminal domain n=1 Tax=Roseobacter sp. TaxID=1907202 RepID=UPI002965ED01|nr:Coenzyme F420 hydrogenase/dehydrogenase, beta subunit C-terminal domain [Roseobacter sp.]MDW3181194.1 Coenzyme F420 hydrogenase/dehydrogenase, beta subunit C-terminal domain [Roseobacter sp.]
MSQKPNFLRKVERGDLCAGCGGCALVSDQKITMETVAPGYLRPRVKAPLSAEEDARIARLCPGLGQSVAAQGRTDDILWGPYEEMCEGWATDPALRHTGSSGAALSAILVSMLDSGLVDGVVQTAADPDRPTANRAVISTTRAEVLAAAGSRYAPSAPLADLGPCLESGKRYAFVGKPCDVAALRALARQDARIEATFVLMVSFFCAGVPSLAGADAVLKALGAAPEEVQAFRYRGNGWPGQATATLQDGQTRAMSYHDSWGGILSKHVQHRCKICADGTGKDADIVCADAWHADEKGYPLFTEDEGISLIVARTALGAAQIAQAETAGLLETRPFDRSRLEAMQPGQSGRRKALLARLIGLRLMGQPIPQYKGLHLRAAARCNSPKVLLRNMLGTMRRVVRPKRG